ncbi:MAG: (d)CMP kinase [Candidatus Daviesbacteria bacterium]|nr:(d)CMP kinase [Candidatus Daviesbacteria bacterium]
MEDNIITIDGPTSSGKNSVGFLLAKKLGYKYIDTGMIYRAICLKMTRSGILSTDLNKILLINKDLNIRFEMNDNWKVFLDEEDVTDKLHTPQISQLVHEVAAQPEVRKVTRGIQKEIAKKVKVVMGGRDIGSEIFPDARFKFWLTASVEERASRRFKQLKEKDSAINFEDVLRDMMERDRHDQEREASPMRKPEDAIVIDNTELNVEETVNRMLDYIQNA